MIGNEDGSPRWPLGRGRPKPDQLVFVDLEASGLDPGSWPIEVGLARLHPDGGVLSEARLIRPHPIWREDRWSTASAAVTGYNLLDAVHVADFDLDLPPVWWTP